MMLLNGFMKDGGGAAIPTGKKLVGGRAPRRECGAN
jgi:hypothetical protein